MTQLRVRRAIPNDAHRIRTLIEHFTGDHTLLPRTEEFISSHCEHFIVAEDGGRVVGCVYLDEYAPSLAELRTLAVDPALHGRGAGKALVYATEELARKRGVQTLFAVSNDVDYFRKFGFEERHIPELDRERGELSRYKFVIAKDLGVV